MVADFGGLVELPADGWGGPLDVLFGKHKCAGAGVSPIISQSRS